MSRVVFCMEGILRSRCLKSTVLAVGVIGGGLAFAAPKVLANDYNPGNQQEPVQAGQVMADTTYEYYELIGDTNSGFEYPKEEMDWEGKIISGNYSEIRLHYPGYEQVRPFEGDFQARIKADDDRGSMAAAAIEIDLFTEDTIKLEELDSLLFAANPYVYPNLGSDYWNLRVELTTEDGDTLTYAYGEDLESSEHRGVRNVAGIFQQQVWYEQKFKEDLREFVRENGLENEKVKSLRFYIENIPGTIEGSVAELDEVHLHATRQIITGAEETPTQRTPELSDVLLGRSNLYQATFPERGTLTIYEASTGRRVQAPIQVHGHVDVDFSGFPAGVYFGVYKPQEGRHQVGKIIKTQ